MGNLIPLREALAHLYSTQADARRVVDDADLNPLDIEFSDKAINTWHSILKEAEKHRAISALFQIAINNYPKNSALISAIQEYYSTALQQPIPAQNHPLITHKINAGSGKYIANNANAESDFVWGDRENDEIQLMFQKLQRVESLLTGPLVEWPDRPKEPKDKTVWDVFDQFKLVIRYGQLCYQCQETDKRQAAYDMAIYQLDMISQARDKLPAGQWLMIKTLIERLHKELSAWQKRKVANPFIFLEPLRGRPPFVGRESELRALRKAGSRGSLQPVLLSGLCHSGKSSLIHKAMFEYKDDILFVLFNIPDPGDKALSTAPTHWALYESLKRRIGQKVDEKEEEKFQTDPAHATEKLIRELCARYGKTTLVIVVDNVDRLRPAAPRPVLKGMKVTNTATTGIEDLFAFWWKLMQGLGNLSFVFVSEAPALSNTPFTPLLKKIRLKNLGTKDVLKLLTTPTPEFTPLFAPATIEYIFELTAGQPYLVQLIAYSVIDQFNEELEKENKPEPVFIPADVDAILVSESFGQFSQFYFQTLLHQLERLRPGSNSVLHAIAQSVDGMNVADLEQNLSDEYQWSDIELILTFLEMEQVIQVEERRFKVVGELLRHLVAGK